MENKDFDIIISNPPYGKIGCEITKRIIDEINYKEFVNLLPVNDYIKRGKKYNLWQYADINSMRSFRDFEDAAVTTHVARILKKPNLFLSADEFEIENFIDPQMTKFFYENARREHYAIDKVRYSGPAAKNIEKPWNNRTTFIIQFRDMMHAHMPYSKSTDTYKWNVEKSIDFDYLIGKRTCKTGQIQISNIDFETAIEKDNFVKFMYSEDGSRFYSKIWTAMNIDGGVKSIGLIKVDWTREWTIEEILKDYGYTDKEIKEVIEDLKNFKGMNA